MIVYNIGYFWKKEIIIDVFFFSWNLKWMKLVLLLKVFLILIGFLVVCMGCEVGFVFILELVFCGIGFIV